MSVSSIPESAPEAAELIASRRNRIDAAHAAGGLAFGIDSFDDDFVAERSDLHDCKRSFEWRAGGGQLGLGLSHASGRDASMWRKSAASRLDADSRRICVKSRRNPRLGRAG